MKASRIIIIVIVVVVIAIVGLYAYESVVLSSTTTSNSPWLSAASYPVQVGGIYGIAGEQCVNTTSNIYCIGGQDVNTGPQSVVYYTPALSASASNITGWTADSNSYPVNTNGGSCTTYSGYVYCVGGIYDDNLDDVASSYYASLTSSGLGTWNSTTAYPIPVDSQSCVTSSGYIYCVGGYNETDGTENDAVVSPTVWYAQVSSSGIGSWKQTTSYPSGVYLPSCYASGGYIYCIGGTDDTGSSSYDNVYYAPLSSSGVGAWTATTAYPISDSGQACVISSGYIYCIGGVTSSSSSSISYTNAVYYAPISSTGIGTWTKGPNYPTSVWTDCAAVSGYVYCVGGFDDSSNQQNPYTYYVLLSSLSS